MDKLSWIKELVETEHAMEESGVINISTGFNPERQLYNQSLKMLGHLKSEFIDASTAFNQMKNSPLGRVKVYSISETQADFMLFRNGFKLIFSLKQPGKISMRFHHAANLNPAFAAKPNDEEFLIAEWGPFGDLLWTYNGKAVKTNYLIRYYTTRFIHESAK